MVVKFIFSLGVSILPPTLGKQRISLALILCPRLVFDRNSVDKNPHGSPPPLFIGLRLNVPPSASIVGPVVVVVVAVTVVVVL